MSELKLVSPLLDGFVMGEPFSDRDGVRCCPAMKENSDDKYIVKIISVPASQKQLDALLFTGAYRDAGEAAEYFKTLAEDTVKEARLLQQLAKLEGFLPFDGWQIVPMEGNELGYDVYLLGSYKRSLEKFLRRNPMTHLGAINLGIDLCTALSLCRRAGFIYTDLKPANIYISGQKEYRIGDLGFAKLNAMKYTSLPGKYISCYTPPELHDPLATLNPTVDTYAVGMILYQIYNNGELPFKTKAPLRYLPTPLNADYELAEIIQKACDPNPRKRYQTPVEMGQALVSYMQRNSVNDIPLVPPTVESVSAWKAETPAKEPEIPVEAPAAAEETAPVAAESVAEVAQSESAVSAESPQDELRFMEELVSDDTAPGTDESDDLADAAMTDEVNEILAQADALLTEQQESGEEADEPAAPEIAEEPAAEEPAEAEESAAEEPAVEESAEEATDVDEEQTETDPDSDFDFSLSDLGIEDEDVDLDFDLPEEEKAPASFGGIPVIDDDGGDVFINEPKQRKKRGWIGVLITLLILALLGSGAFLYYTNYYLLPIDNMEISSIEGGISVALTTDVDEVLLKVSCVDTYGNKQEQLIFGGKAVFTNLVPDTTYKVTVESEGFHKVTGSFTGSYTTAKVTDIIDFTAKSGTENGSVILTFIVDGPETNEWTVEYSAEGEETRSESFTGHMVDISGLTVGKLYTFTLVAPPAAELYLVGETTLEHQAAEVVVAEDLAILSCDNGILTAQWTNTQNTAVENWIVRCYSEDGYDETVTVSNTHVRFENIRSDTAYTVEVTAEGMSQSARAFVTANPATVTNLQLNFDQKTGLTLNWESSATPAGGWLVLYSVDGSDTTEMAECTNTTATIKNVIPNAPYDLQIKAADGATVFGGNITFSGVEAVPFDQYGLRADAIQSSLCHTPEKEGWTYEDVKNDDYTTSFASGEKASLVLYTNAQFYLKSEPATVMYVIRNADGFVIPNFCRTVTAVWRDLWPGVGKYCYLDIPVMPTAEGKYTLEVYFNGGTVLTKSFSIINAHG